MRIAAAFWSLLPICLFLQPAWAATEVGLGRAEAPLHGPWAFRTGDDLRWADPAFDDGDWERVDLTPAPDAHDPDVGLTGYVPGWTERGHAGYHGYAWYRLHLHWRVPADTQPLLLGPAYVEDAYEIYWNGQRIGASGDFSTNPPRVLATRPSLFRVPAQQTDGDALVAIRVYLSPSVSHDGDAGGIHIAPILATTEAGIARHWVQWSQTFLGYVIEVIEPALFALVAAFALSLGRFDRTDRFYRAFAWALLLAGAMRLHQAVLFWGGFEDLHSFAFIRYAGLEPASLMAWIVAWNRWTPPRRGFDLGALALALLDAGSGLAGDDLAWLRSAVRLAFVALFAAIAIRIALHGRLRVAALVALALCVAGTFAEELSKLGVPGIWFPFGIGVSRTQYIYLALIPWLALLCHWRSSPAGAGARTGADAPARPIPAGAIARE